jgi:hypothetical protein
LTAIDQNLAMQIAAPKKPDVQKQSLTVSSRRAWQGRSSHALSGGFREQVRSYPNTIVVYRTPRAVAKPMRAKLSADMVKLKPAKA